MTYVLISRFLREPVDARVDTMQCNICDTIASTATPDGVAATDICAGCQLRVRHRAVSNFLSSNPQVSRIIENGHALFCHLTPNEREFLFKGCRDFLNFDIRPMKYLDLTMDIQDMHRIQTASLDSFIAIHVLNHVPDDMRAIREIARILKPLHGVFLATAPVRLGVRTQLATDVTQHYGEAALKEFGVGSFRHYGLDDLIALLKPFFWVETHEFRDPLVTATEIVFCCFRKPNIGSSAEVT
jgi:SAM-dependent methyltransferase